MTKIIELSYAKNTNESTQNPHELTSKYLTFEGSPRFYLANANACAPLAARIPRYICTVNMHITLYLHILLFHTHTDIIHPI